MQKFSDETISLPCHSDINLKKIKSDYKFNQ